MQQDALTLDVVRAGNDNLFRSDIFSQTVATLIGKPIEIYNTTGAIGAARAAGIENKSINDYSQSVASMDFVSEVLPIKEKQAYIEAYHKWKQELTRALNNLN